MGLVPFLVVIAVGRGRSNLVENLIEHFVEGLTARRGGQAADQVLDKVLGQVAGDAREFVIAILIVVLVGGSEVGQHVPNGGTGSATPCPDDAGVAGRGLQPRLLLSCRPWTTSEASNDAANSAELGRSQERPLNIVLSALVLS